MITKQYTVNEEGLDEIHTFLSEKHKLDGTHFNRSMLQAWAQDAEFQLSEGNPASVEIRAFDAVSGHTEEYTISPAGLDFKLITVEE